MLTFESDDGNEKRAAKLNICITTRTYKLCANIKSHVIYEEKYFLI